MAESCVNVTRPTPLHTNLMESGPENTFAAENRKKTDGGGFTFSTFSNPPSPQPPPPLKKVCFKWWGSRGVPVKNSLGGAFIGGKNDFTRG